MKTQVALGDFEAVLSRTQVILSTWNNVPNPFKDARDLSVFKTVVEDGRRLLPARYQGRYVNVLARLLNQAETALAHVSREDRTTRQSIFDTLSVLFTVLASPIVQLKSPALQRQLKAFLATISNVYRRFINDEQVRKGAKLQLLSPDLDPLGSFSRESVGPFTLPASDDLPVAIVSKPANQMNFLPLWSADGHEVGGHDIYGAVRGFSDDLTFALERNIRSAFRSGHIRTASKYVLVPAGKLLFWTFYRRLSIEDFMVAVWRAWLSESAADHAGLVNMGPMYLNSLMLMVSAIRPGFRLTGTSLFDRNVFRRDSGFEEHPADVVRALLAIEAIRRLSFGNGNAYADALLERLLRIHKGLLPTTVDWLNRKGEIVISIPLADIQQLLPVVSQTIYEAKLPALGDQSFGSIINWEDSDERIVAEVAASLRKGDTAAGDSVKPRHVVAASMLAVEQASTEASDFAAACRLIHDSGISMLVDIYDEQCVLCSVTRPFNLAPPPRVDMNRLFEQISTRASLTGI